TGCGSTSAWHRRLARPSARKRPGWCGGSAATASIPRPGGRQGVRHRCFRRDGAGRGDHAARRRAHYPAPGLEPRRLSEWASWLRVEPAGPEADRGDLRLGQDHRWLAEELLPRPATASGPTSSPPPTTWSGW